MSRWVEHFPPLPSDCRVPRGILAYVRSGWSPAHPTFVERGAGSRVWDAQGRAYVDWVQGKGAVTLGHARSEVDTAAYERARRGVLLPGCVPEYLELAALLCERVGIAERAAFVKNGSDAVNVAMELARTFTSRDLVASSGYHGWDARFSESEPEKRSAIDFGYDLDALTQLVEAHGKRLAAILVTPEPAFLPEEFLSRVRELASAAGALLIVDEVRCGMRVARGGEHERVGVVPDLVTLSKGLANGYPLAAVLGRADVMEASRDTYVFGTYYAEALSLAAALVVQHIYDEERVIERLADVGQALTRLVDAAFEDAGIDAHWVGPSSLPQLVFRDPNVEASFYEELAREGVLFFQDDGQCPSVAHDEESLELTTRAVRAVARRLPAGERTATPVAETLARYAAMRGIRSPRVRRPRSDAPADER
ncbi:MAG: aminotransferase class III-fold pyridoxal phosphate-dependent enzyme [Myxococcales bacterium]|nr:aminotransferase class III-fold pyridoxal phosphate-dependent enzyme [Myxococcales bacterium]